MGCLQNSFAWNTLEPSIYLINQHLLNAYEVHHVTHGVLGGYKKEEIRVSVPRELIN